MFLCLSAHLGIRGNERAEKEAALRVPVVSNFKPAGSSLVTGKKEIKSGKRSGKKRSRGGVYL